MPRNGWWAPLCSFSHGIHTVLAEALGCGMSCAVAVKERPAVRPSPRRKIAKQRIFSRINGRPCACRNGLSSIFQPVNKVVLRDYTSRHAESGLLQCADSFRPRTPDLHTSGTTAESLQPLHSDES